MKTRSYYTRMKRILGLAKGRVALECEARIIMGDLATAAWQHEKEGFEKARDPKFDREGIFLKRNDPPERILLVKLESWKGDRWIVEELDDLYKIEQSAGSVTDFCTAEPTTHADEGRNVILHLKNSFGMHVTFVWRDSHLTGIFDEI